ncbi:MAG: alpha/beta hydrolase [Actinobacteria bacterium]|nr:alpha/beta hydrolase [Actinomycetota bacterium]
MTADASTRVAFLPSLGRYPNDFATLMTSVASAGFEPVPVTFTTNGVRTLHDLAGQAAAALGNAGPPAHVVGHALGNRIARCLAADYPELVRSVTLLAAGGRVPPDDEAAVALLNCFDTSLSAGDHLAAVATAFFAPGNDAAVWADGWDGVLAEVQAAAVRATSVDDWWTAGGTAPVLVIQGLDDRVAPPGNGRDLVEQIGERARLVELADAGHALLPEQPAAIAAALLEFLSRC